MAEREDLDLGPVMGWALWQLQHGHTPSEVDTMMENHRKYGGLSENTRRLAVYRAAENFEAMQRYPAASAAWYFGRLFGVTEESEAVGIRMTVDVRQNDGVYESRTITVNGRMGMSIVAVIDRIMSLLNSQGFGGQGGDSLPATGGSVDNPNYRNPQIFQVIRYGLENARFNL